MKPGLYEHIINLLLKQSIESIDRSKIIAEPLDSSDSHDYLAQYLYKVLAKGLKQVKYETGCKTDKEKNASRIQRQIEICNEIIGVLENSGLDYQEEKVSTEARRLLGVLENVGLKKKAIERPDTPLSLGALLTGTRQDPSFISQLQKEIATADRVDILCSFIKWSGIRILEPALRMFTARNNSKLRIITTSYMGATDIKAICFLAELPNTEIKISYDTDRTRLHAKAYLIHRKTEFSSAYIGSANISKAALTEGLEWNVKISQYEQPFQWEKVSATFETYWNDDEFEFYDNKNDEAKLIRALTEEKFDKTRVFVMPNFDIRPYVFQKEILEKIEAEREFQKINKHLIVAATGTGKTMIAAFDYKEWKIIQRRKGLNREPRFLFVAHREEILEQSMWTFRAVLRDQNFGDLMVGGHRPSQLDQLFVSIQTYNSKNLSQLITSENYEYIVIDEFHHAAAPSYQDLLNHIKPKSLLGLTATPERTDAKDILKYFDDHITAEIRLSDAVNRKLLCPFQYFGISDSVDYSSLRWQRGGYVHTELDKALTGNDVRANLIIEKTAKTVLDIQKSRGLGFCVSQAHAEYMCQKFNDAGISSAFLTALSSKEERSTIQNRLRDREINFIFVVDLYNEGVDIQEIDTVLFLRPTESLTVFLQQLGRGLRLHDEKDCLTVLDFVGHAHKKYRFDIRFKALVTDTSKPINKEFEEGFPHLPAGCSIQFEKKARQYVLDNIKQSLIQSKPRIIRNIADFSADTGLPLTLKAFIKHYSLELDDIYRRASWSRLCVEADVRGNFSEPDELLFTKGLRRLKHMNDYKLIECIQEHLSKKQLYESNLSSIDKKRLLMFCFSLWGESNLLTRLEDNIARIHNNPVLKNELFDLLTICKGNIESIEYDEYFHFDCPLLVHAKYTRDEILVALGYKSLQSKPSMREGVVYLSEKKTDAFFITLNKNEKHYSPTTMYDDYAISDTLFHWQSQATTSEQSPTGQRYINHKKMGHTILLFVRENNIHNNLAEPYYFLGSADYVSHSGSKPISIKWKLNTPMPPHLLRQTARMVVV